MQLWHLFTLRCLRFEHSCCEMLDSALIMSQTHNQTFSMSNGLGTFTGGDSDSDPDFNTAPVLNSHNGNLNHTPCSVNSSAYYN